MSTIPDNHVPEFSEKPFQRLASGLRQPLYKITLRIFQILYKLSIMESRVATRRKHCPRSKTLMKELHKAMIVQEAPWTMRRMRRCEQEQVGINKQLTEIIQELSKTNCRLEEAELMNWWIRIRNTGMGTTLMLLKCLEQHKTSMEETLVDQGSHIHRGNIQIYSMPEEADGNNITSFLKNLLRDSNFSHGNQEHTEPWQLNPQTQRQNLGLLLSNSPTTE